MSIEQQLEQAIRERDEAIERNKSHVKVNTQLIAELTQLRKVCDDLAACVENTSKIGTRSCKEAIERSLLSEEQHKANCVYHRALTNYSTLPHVVKAKGMK
jgi:hypothetical protein